MQRMGWTAMWLAFGCHGVQPQSSTDRATYQQVVADRRVPPKEGLGACATIADDVLSGDCALHVMSVESRRPDGRPSRWCPQIPAGLWRDECWFIAAEQANRSGRGPEAVSFCQRAGEFANDCAQHLWQSEVRALIHRRGSRAFSEVLPAADKVHAQWSPLLGETTDFDARFWAKFFQNGFEGQGSFVDLYHCDLITRSDIAQRCVDAGRQLYERELDPRLEHSRVDLCTLTAEDAGWSTTLLRWLPCRPDPRLDAVVAARLATCP